MIPHEKIKYCPICNETFEKDVFCKHCKKEDNKRVALKTKIIISDSVTEIPKSCFKGRKSITSVHIPDSVTAIYAGAFEGCTSLEEINIPDSVTVIGDCAFYECIKLKKITIPDAVDYLGELAFMNCISLEEVNFLCEVTSIPKNCFKYCSSLKTIVIPDSIKEINEFAFFGCRSLSNIIFPNNLKEIGRFAFAFCESLKKISLPENIEDVQVYAFSNCINLEEVSIPDTMDFSIERNLLRELKFLFGNENSKLLYRWVFHGCKIRNFNHPNFQIENGLLIKDNVLLDCTDSSVQEVTIPDGVTTILNSAFDSCRQLKRVFIPDSVLKIESYAFINCISLEEIKLPDSVTEIQDFAFKNTHIKNLNHPAITISDGFCVEAGELKYLSCLPDSYIITIPSGICKIGESAFCGYKRIEEVVISEDVSAIDRYAFEKCINLKKIQFSDSISEINIHFSAFDGCKSVDTVVCSLRTAKKLSFDLNKPICWEIHDNVSELESECASFSLARKCKKVIIPDSVEKIKNKAFDNFLVLQDIVIPDSVVEIEAGAFPSSPRLSKESWDSILSHGYQED